VAFTKFVVERRMPLSRFVDITSANAAWILGLYPQKGAIQPCSDADRGISRISRGHVAFTPTGC